MECSIERSYRESVFFDKHIGHSHVLQKCKEVTWGDTDCRVYLSDGSGSEIADEPVVTGSKTVPWSLGSYMHACNMYASRTRLYCVCIGMVCIPSMCMLV